LANHDRAGGLFCQLVSYLNGGRIESTAFLEAFPSTKKETAMLWELDAIAAAQGKSMFPPRGPSYELIDELFLLVMDGHQQAIKRYFHFSTNVNGEKARYLDEQIKIFLCESQYVVVTQWAMLRQYKPRLQSVIRMIANGSSPTEMQKIRRAVKKICENENAECAEILKLYGVK
jgi:hypothetical protein